ILLGAHRWPRRNWQTFVTGRNAAVHPYRDPSPTPLPAPADPFPTWRRLLCAVACLANDDRIVQVGPSGEWPLAGPPRATGHVVFCTTVASIGYWRWYKML